MGERWKIHQNNKTGPGSHLEKTCWEKEKFHPEHRTLSGPVCGALYEVYFILRDFIPETENLDVQMQKP